MTVVVAFDATRRARELVEEIRTAEHEAHVRARARLRKIDDQAGTWLGTTRETRAMRALYEPLLRDELARRRAVLARKLRKYARTLRHHGLLVAGVPQLEVTR